MPVESHVVAMSYIYIMSYLINPKLLCIKFPIAENFASMV